MGFRGLPRVLSYHSGSYTTGQRINVVFLLTKFVLSSFILKNQGHDHQVGLWIQSTHCETNLGQARIS